MRCRIHRGCHEIGGNCVEIESHGQRVLLDIGLPLTGDSETGLPQVSGLTTADESLLGIFVSHPHPDHYGLLEKITQPVPVYIGEASRRIIEVSSFFTPLPALGNVETRPFLEKPIELGPFRVTPFRVDHSAFDSRCMLIECDGKRLLYSGDLRGHGHKSHLFDSLIDNPPADIDVLICEGTQLGRDQHFPFPDEQSVSDRMGEVFTEAEGLCLVWCSSQNIDRLISVWQACQNSGRQLIVDVYTAEVMRAAGETSLPTPDDPRVSVFLPHFQRSKIIREQAFERSDKYRRHRIYKENLAAAASNSVMIFRPSMLRELEANNCVGKAVLVTSLWTGYFRHPSVQRMFARLEELEIERFHAHTSGHATVDELSRFINAIPAKRVVPIHLEDRQAFAQLTDRADIKNDGEWWEV